MSTGMVSETNRKTVRTLEEVRELLQHSRFLEYRDLSEYNRVLERADKLLRELLGRHTGIAPADISTEALLQRLEPARHRRLLTVYAETMLRYGRMQRHARRTARFKDNARAVQAIFAALGDESGRARAKLDLADGLLRSGDTKEALELLSELEPVFERQGQLQDFASVKMLMGRIDRARGELESALANYQAARGLYASHGDAEGVLLAENNIGLALSQLGKTAEAMALYNRILDTAREMGLARVQFWILSNRMSLEARTGKNDERLKSLLECLELSRKTGDVPGEVTMLNNLGIFFQWMGDTGTALEYFLRLLEIRKEHNIGDMLSSALNNLGGIYITLKEYDRSLVYIRESIALAEEYKQDLFRAVAYNTYGDALIGLGRLDEAREAVRTGLAYFNKNGVSQWQADGNYKLARIYRRQGNAEAALHTLLQALDIARRAKLNMYVCDVKQELAALHLECGRVQQATAYYRDVLTLACEIDAELHVCNAHKGLAECYAFLNDYKSALDHHRQCLEIHEKLHNAQSDERLRRQQVLLDTERAQHEQLLLRLKNTHLQRELDSRQKHLTTQAMFLAQTQERNRNLKKELMELTGLGKRDIDKHLQRIIAELNANDNERSTWKSFEEEFQNLHPEFLSRLAAGYPGLTPTELKVCALIKMNLSSKDVSRILSVSPRAIESYRYRIRKKLRLDSESNLSVFLAGL